MTLLLVALISGILSVLAPCIIGLLPLLIGYSAESKNFSKALRVVLGLSLSIFIFSILLKATTSLIGVSSSTWQLISGGIIILFGLSSLFPEIWERLASRLKLQQISSKGQQSAFKRGGKLGDVLLGASLGPIFSACSPTYALIVASILPASPLRGLLYLLVFIAGLAGMILLIALLGQKLISKIGWSINPHGWFKRVLGILFIIIGLMIITGIDKSLLAKAVESGWFDWQVSLESKLQ